MILDARFDHVPMDWAVQVAIVGAGPAGMTLARELAGRARVLVIEAGGIGSEPDQQALLSGECVGMDYPLTETRARQFGGSSALWAGYCAQFDAHDFSVRPWVPLSGWPFGVEALQPYYPKAAEILHLGQPDFDARQIAKHSPGVLQFDESFVPTVWRFGSPIKRFGEELRPEFEGSAEITTLIHANVVDIRLDAGHCTVSQLDIRTLEGRQGRVRAGIVVLACGGIESARILLNADTQVCHGLGNSSGMVGRCFMEHPHRAIGPLVIEYPGAFESWTRRAVDDRNREYTPCVGLSRHAQQAEQIMNARAHIYRTPAMADDEPPQVGLFMEQAPNPESRVLLSDTTDGLGMRRVRLDWQLTDLDWQTYRKTASAIASEFERVGAGRMTSPIRPSARDREPVLHSNHHLGTTRMAENREEGVVDPDCRVHDLSNLYIVGGSVFPTVSWANPTFTVMALTLRLAGHLRTALSPRAC